MLDVFSVTFRGSLRDLTQYVPADTGVEIYFRFPGIWRGSAESVTAK